MIKIINLKKAYNEGDVPVQALRGVSFDIEKGEFVAIMGASGSGKSTLLHQLGLLDSPSSGEYLIDKKSVLRVSEKVKERLRLKYMGYIFQDYALLPELTILENAALPMMTLGKTKKESMDLAVEYLKKVGMGHKLHKLERQLSGGEKQRAAIARALVNQPKILFADEPCANLDSENSTQILELFKKLNRELGQTIIMVTHEEWHKNYANRLILLQDGKIIQDKKLTPNI